MTDQEVFDKVVTHLIAQGVPSQSVVEDAEVDVPVCLYRGPEGAKCAVGCLIPDDIYHSDMEGKVVYTLGVHDERISVLLGLGSTSRLKLLERLQGAHDSFFGSVDSLVNQLRYIANDSNLNTKVLDEQYDRSRSI
jgi:hypothetical protein